MAWPKGQPREKKNGGRKAGVPNKRTEDLRERIEELLNGEDLPSIILAKINKLPGEKQVHHLMNLMPYVYPRRKAVDITSDGGQPKTFVDFMKAALEPDDEDEDKEAV